MFKKTMAANMQFDALQIIMKMFSRENLRLVSI